MEQFLADAPLGALLGLMVIPVTGVLLLGTYIIIVFYRRKRKPQVDQDIQPETVSAETILPVDSPKFAPNVLPPNDVKPLNIEADQSKSSHSFENRLNLALLSSALDTEETMSEPETIDLSSRLTPKPADLSQQTQNSEPVELLRLLRSQQSGRLIVEIAGKRYTKLADITDKKVGQYILQLTAHMLAFTSGKIVTDAGMKSVYTPKLGKTPEPMAPPAMAFSDNLSTPQPPMRSKPSPPKASPEVESEFLASLQASPPQQPEQKPQKRGFLGLGRASKPSPPPLPGLNLAEEINDIVQARLDYSPTAPNTQIEITSDPGGGIRIQVNDQFYSSPDDISDQEVRALIKASIKEWEDK